MKITKKLAIGIASGALLLSTMGTTAYANHETANSGQQTASFHVGGNFNSQAANFGKRTPLFAFLNGEAEVPGPGDENAFGFVKVQVQPDKENVCVNMHIFGISPATAAHIHEAPEGQAGPVVVTLPTPNAKGFANGCVEVTEEIAEEILENPSDYYVNVHNSFYPAGAVRGQL